MASYHTSFTYKDKNSLDEGYVITAFEPDSGFTDSFLSMENISDDYFDGTKKFNYGSKYSSSPEIQITLIKKDGTDMSVKDFRSCAKWLTGARTDSWLDMYNGDTIVYAFLGKFTNMEQYKIDARTIGCRLTFSSVSPWAYSTPTTFDYIIGQSLEMKNNILQPVERSSTLFGINEDGYLYDASGNGNDFSIDNKAIAYIDTTSIIQADNQTDDLYTYIYLDVEYTNRNSESVTIENMTLGETTEIKGLNPNEIIMISAKQFIVSYGVDINGNRVQNNRIFGDDFNFVWPRLAPGMNQFIVTAPLEGYIKFSYRYPMKVGDFAMDISTYGSDNICGDCSEIPSYDTVRWQDITGLPNTLAGYGISDTYTSSEIDDKLENINVNVNVEWGDITNTPTTIEGYGVTDVYTKDEVYNKIETDEKIDNIEVSGGGGGSANVDEDELNNMLADILS